MRPYALPALLAFAPLLAFAQQSGDVSRLTGTAERVTASAPTPAAPAEATVSADDLDEVGPLQVLVPSPAHRWFEAGAEAQVMWTDNAALLEPKTGSDVYVFAAHLGVNAKPIEFAGGRLGLTARYDYAAFGYGFLTNRRNHVIDGSVRRLQDLDFQSHTGTIATEWHRGGWNAESGLRVAAFFGTRSGDREYSETVPYLRAAHTSELSRRDFLTVGAEIDYRFTHTPLPAGFADIIGTDLNDRFDTAGSLAYTRLLGEQWYLQPSYRLNFARYTQGGSTPGRDGAGAETWTHTLQFNIGYVPSPRLTARVFLSVEAREADEATMPDYRVTNLGLGAALTARF